MLPLRLTATDGANQTLRPKSSCPASNLRNVTLPHFRPSHSPAPRSPARHVEPLLWNVSNSETLLLMCDPAQQLTPSRSNARLRGSSGRSGGGRSPGPGSEGPSQPPTSASPAPATASPVPSVAPPLVYEGPVYNWPRPLPAWLNRNCAKHIVKGNFMTLSARPKTVEQGEWIGHQGTYSPQNTYLAVRNLTYLSR